MDTHESVSSDDSALLNEQIVANMGQIDRREWWLWSSALSVMILLSLGIASFAVPALLSGFDGFHTFFLSSAVRGLFGLVLVFNVYVVNEQIQINRERAIEEVSVTAGLRSLWKYRPVRWGRRLV